MGSINLAGVSKSFGDVLVIPSVDLEVNEGEFVVFVGPSGSGKSTLLRLIAGLEEVSKGCLLYTSPSPRDGLLSRMPSSA